jgi:transcriptional regulator EpsA
VSTPHAVSHDSECLLRIIEAAGRVQSRAQFFVWSQGDLQRWLPHKLMVCGAFDLVHRHMVFHVFNSVPLSTPLQRALNDSSGPLLQWAQQAWLSNRRQPTRLQVPKLSADDVSGLLLQAQVEQLLAHGLCRPGRPDDIESLFLLASPGREVDDASGQAMGWLMPYIHITYQRVFENEREMARQSSGASGAAARGQLITKREAELLHWVREGMSNQQIAEQLHISALTVKNHIQKILKKLGAANRTQAVAMAISHKLLQPPSQLPHS